jgi:hypothetical protein
VTNAEPSNEGQLQRWDPSFCTRAVSSDNWDEDQPQDHRTPAMSSRKQLLEEAESAVVVVGVVVVVVVAAADDPAMILEVMRVKTLDKTPHRNSQTAAADHQ